MTTPWWAHIRTTPPPELTPAPVYVFVRSGTTWTEQAHTGTAGDFFGWSVASAGDTVLVDAILDDTAAGVNAGSVYVFVISAAPSEADLGLPSPTRPIRSQSELPLFTRSRCPTPDLSGHGRHRYRQLAGRGGLCFGYP